MDAPGPGQPITFDERYLAEFFELIFSELVALLANYARFDEWCASHELEH